MVSNPIFLSQHLNQQNYSNECAKSIATISRDRIHKWLRSWGLTAAPPEVVHRLHVFILHAENTQEKERSLWW